MNQEAHELAGVLGSPFLSVSEGRGSSRASLAKAPLYPKGMVQAIPSPSRVP
jgi:hypothetical protein